MFQNWYDVIALIFFGGGGHLTGTNVPIHFESFNVVILQVAETISCVANNW